MSLKSPETCLFVQESIHADSKDKKTLRHCLFVMEFCQ